jgi:rhamnose transport system substrate-binding protein
VAAFFTQLDDVHSFYGLSLVLLSAIAFALYRNDRADLTWLRCRCFTPAALAPLLVGALTLAACERDVPRSVDAKNVSATTVPAGWEAGIAQGAPDRSGRHILIKDVPKLIGVPYFSATSRGMRQAAEELGNVTVQTDAPTEARVEWQIQFIERLLSSKLDVLVVAANDRVKVAPVLSRALERGVRVISYDSDVLDAAREFFVNQAAFADIARTLVEEMVKQTGPVAEVAIVTSTFTTPNQARWIEEMNKYIGERYPKLKVVAILPSEEDQGLAVNATEVILRSYPKVKGIFGISTVAFPGAAAAVKRAGQCGRIAVVGLSTPNQMRSYMEEGCIKSSILWNAVDLGYATVYAARALADGALRPGATELAAGRLGRLTVRGSEIILGPPLVFTPENIGQFNF